MRQQDIATIMTRTGALGLRYYDPPTTAILNSCKNYLWTTSRRHQTGAASGAAAYAVGRRDRLFDVRALLTRLIGGSLGGRVGVCFRSSRASFPRHSRIHAETLEDVAAEDVAGDDVPKGDVAGRDRRAVRVSFLVVTKARLLLFGGTHAFLSP